MWDEESSRYQIVELGDGSIKVQVEHLLGSNTVVNVRDNVLNGHATSEEVAVSAEGLAAHTDLTSS